MFDDENPTRVWPLWLSVPVATAVALVVVAAIASVVVIDRWRNADDRGLQRAEARVTAVLPETSDLESADAIRNQRRLKTYRDSRARGAVERDLRGRFARAGLLYPGERDAGVGTIPLRTGPRYYVEVRFLVSSTNGTRFETFTHIED